MQQVSLLGFKSFIYKIRIGIKSIFLAPKTLSQTCSKMEMLGSNKTALPTIKTCLRKDLNFSRIYREKLFYVEIRHIFNRPGKVEFLHLQR